MGEFVLDYNVDAHCKRSEFEPLDIAKSCFLRRDFEGMIPVLENALAGGELSDSQREACQLNLAMAYHVRGYYEQALEAYEKCARTCFWSINNYAFCHRYFEYKKIKDMKYDGNLSDILDHNRLNYFLNVYGAERALLFWNNRKTNIYDEQIINEIRTRYGEPIAISEEIAIENQYSAHLNVNAFERQKNSTKVASKKNIGIYITDLQRHKDSALLYQIVDELNVKYDIVLYFNNIFQNKLIKSFGDRCKFRDVSHLSSGDISKIFSEDQINLIIDTAEYGLRNNSIALSQLGQYRVFLSDIIKNCNVFIESDQYFPTWEPIDIRDSVLILGDLRYVRQKDLVYIRDHYHMRHIVFESHALDESAFYEVFQNRLREVGFDLEYVELVKGVLPFSKYMQYISSFEEIVLLPCSTFAEISEAIHSRTPVYYMGDNKILERAKKTTVVDYVDSCLKTLNGRYVCIPGENCNLVYIENNKTYSVNCTCNGDLLVFQDGGFL